MNDIYVRVLNSKAKHGGFSNVEAPCWTVDLVDEDTGVHKALCSGMNEWSRYFNEDKAIKVAEEWAGFLGCKVRHFTTVPKTVFEHVEVYK